MSKLKCLVYNLTNIVQTHVYCVYGMGHAINMIYTKYPLFIFLAKEGEEEEPVKERPSTPEEYGIPQLELSDSDSDSVSLYVPYFQKKVFFRGRFILIKDEEIQ